MSEPIASSTTTPVQSQKPRPPSASARPPSSELANEAANTSVAARLCRLSTAACCCRSGAERNKALGILQTVGRELELPHCDRAALYPQTWLRARATAWPTGTCGPAARHLPRLGRPRRLPSTDALAHRCQALLTGGEDTERHYLAALERPEALDRPRPHPAPVRQPGRDAPAARPSPALNSLPPSITLSARVPPHGA